MHEIKNKENKIKTRSIACSLKIKHISIKIELLLKSELIKIEKRHSVIIIYKEDKAIAIQLKKKEDRHYPIKH